MATTKIANKLTLEEMGLSKSVIQETLKDAAEGSVVVIALMYGKATRYTTRPSKLDPTREDVCFVGEFEGQNLLTGQVCNAAKAYLPGAAEASMRNAVDMMADGEAVEFACEIAAKKKASSAVGYVFGVSVPKPPTAQDNLAALRASLTPTRTVPALEAPAADEPPVKTPRNKKAD